MGIKEGIKTARILVVYIPAMMAKVIVTCINNTLKSIPYSSLVTTARQFTKQKVTIPIKADIKN